MELVGIKLSEVAFKKHLSSSIRSEIFLVTIRDTTCVMKVLHDYGEGEHSTPEYQKNMYINESTTYKRMKEHGLCDRGFVPQFYGTIEKLDPKLYQSHLDVFSEDKNLPNAILLEYLPDMEKLNLKNYTRERMVRFISIMDEIHKLVILHYDIHPRNMMVFPDYPTRVMWIDFDAAQAYNKGQLTDRQNEWFAEEDRKLRGMGKKMEADIEEGRVNRTARYFCSD